MNNRFSFSWIKRDYDEMGKQRNLDGSKTRLYELIDSKDNAGLVFTRSKDCITCTFVVYEEDGYTMTRDSEEGPEYIQILDNSIYVQYSNGEQRTWFENEDDEFDRYFIYWLYRLPASHLYSNNDDDDDEDDEDDEDDYEPVIVQEAKEEPLVSNCPVLHERTECAICMEFDDPTGEGWYWTKCGHAFHVCDLKKWFKSDMERRCPMCRAQL